MKRTIQVRFVKTPKDQDATPDQEDIDLEGKAAIIGHYLSDIVDKAGRVALTYVLINAAGKCAVAFIESKKS